MPAPRLRAALLAAALLASTAACSAAFGPMRQRTFDEAPYYIGVAPRDTLPLARLQVAFDRHDSNADDHGAGGPGIRALVGVIDAYLDSLPAAGRPARVAPAALAGGAGRNGGAPDVFFGCDADAVVFGTASECAVRRHADSIPRDPQNMLRADQPSKAWRRDVRRVADAAGAERVLVITLEFTKMWPSSRGLLDRKEAQLGTGHVVPLPWLTAQDLTLDALVLTGALVDRDGKVVRAGAEGLVVKRTRLLAGAFGVEELLSDADVDRLLAARRADLAGQPLVWKVAVENLVAQLTGAGAVRAVSAR